MGFFQIGSSLLGEIVTDFDWHNFVQNQIRNRNMPVNLFNFFLSVERFYFDLSGEKQEK